MANERYLALRVLERVEREGAYSNLALEEALRTPGLERRQRAFVRALVAGVLKRRLTLDHILRAYLHRPLEKLDWPVLCILRLGLYQMYYMQGVPQRAALDESVKLCTLARKKSAGGFVNGVLRSVQRDGCALPPCPPRPGEGEGAARLRLLEATYSAPAPLIASLLADYGEGQALEVLAASLEPAPLFVRVNTLRTEPGALAAALIGEGVPARGPSCPGAPPGCLLLEKTGGIGRLAAFSQGLFHVEDLSSQACAAALCAAPGMRVLDACAAPGGKSFTVAQHMGDEGEIEACDIHPHKLELLSAGAKRLGLSAVRPLLRDAAAPCPGAGPYQRVLCDVPCSGWGLLRRKPEVKYKAPNEIAALPDIQYKILENSANYLQEGGVLVYSTCTLRRAENEEVVARFLRGHPAFAPWENPALGGAWQKTLLPGEGWPGDGFFIASLQKARARERGEP